MWDNVVYPGAFLMFNRIFEKLRLKKNTVRHQIVKDKTETKKYLDSECNLYRYSKFNHYSEKMMSYMSLLKAFHTIPVHEEIEFEEATSSSIAFKANHEDFKKSFSIIIH